MGYNLRPMEEGFTYLGMPKLWGKNRVQWFQYHVHRVDKRIKVGELIIYHKLGKPVLYSESLI